MKLEPKPVPVKVLVVDDSEEDFLYFSHLLRRNSGRYETIWARSFADGRRSFLEDGSLHIALVDYSLGGQTGLELLRELNNEGVEIPIIILTGHDNSEFDDEALEAGAADYLCKQGLSALQLERSIRYSLRHAEMLAEIRQSQRQLELFVKSVPCAICVEDEAGNVLFKNPQYSEFFKDGQFSPTEVTGQSWSFSERGRHWLIHRFEIAESRKLRGVAAIDITERVKAEEMLRRTNSMLSGILTHLPVAVSRIDYDGTILELSGRGLSEVGIDGRALTGRNLFSVNPAVGGEVVKALKGGSAEFVTGVNFGGRTHHFHTHFRFDHARGRGAIGVGVDITRRVESEMAFKRQSQILTAILNSLPVVVGRLDKNGNVIEAEGEGMAKYGLAPADLVSQEFVELFPDATAALAQALAGETVGCELSGGEAGPEWNAELFLCPDSEHQDGVIFYARDLSERKWLERKILDISDAEQQRIGADLHDGLGQHLTGIACLAAALRDRLGQIRPAESEQANLIARLVNEATAQCRAMARGLCPVQLEHAGLIAALEDLTNQVQMLSRIECRFEVVGPPPSCNHETELHVYRIVQEALNNVVRHSGARSVVVSAMTDSQRCCITVQDDGCGIEKNGQPSRDGVGLRLMHYRAAIVGGHFEIKPCPQGGARVEVIFPTHTGPYDEKQERTLTAQYS